MFCGQFIDKSQKIIIPFKYQVKFASQSFYKANEEADRTKPSRHFPQKYLHPVSYYYYCQFNKFFRNDFTQQLRKLM